MGLLRNNAVALLTNSVTSWIRYDQFTSTQFVAVNRMFHLVFSCTEHLCKICIDSNNNLRLDFNYFWLSIKCVFKLKLFNTQPVLSLPNEQNYFNTVNYKLTEA